MWHPTASLNNIKLRATVLAKIRTFFAERGVTEVETPLLCQATVTDPHIQSFTTQYQQPGVATTQTFYLQTSPEFAMKRLLAAGSGAIYQICKAFRNDGEFGPQHNPEFTMLEWYRPGFTQYDLMDETDSLLQTILTTPAAERISYADLFLRHTDINPHTISLAQLKTQTKNLLAGKVVNLNSDDPNDWLYLLLTHCIEPQLGRDRPAIVYDFPVTQAALARIRHENPPVAERFEVYINGIELANGYHELADANEQQQRLHKDLQRRKQLGYVEPPVDQHLLAALQQGMPDCAGIALGVDRLLMLAAQANSLAEIITFPFDRA